jgi:imidazolonepropionase-like amidohydrolase
MNDTTEGSWVLTNARLFTGVDESVIENGAVWVEGRHIRYAGRAAELRGVPDGVRRIDVGGQFVIPGMTESHAHLSYTNNGPTELDKTPVEEAMVHSIDNARLMLGAGFTSAISFGSVHRIDVYLRDSIDKGLIPGPRLMAGGRDVGATGSNADLHADYARPQMEGLGMLANGPWEVRRAVRTLRKNKANVIKLFLDGEGLSNHAPPGELTYTDEEVAAAVQEAHARNMKVACHSRSAIAVKQAVRHRVDYIGHANYLDDEAVDMLRANRHRLFVGPAIAWEIQFLANCEQMGIPRAVARQKGYEREVEATVDAVRRLRAAGVRVLIGGDYGLNITPHGTYAKDLEYFVDLFGLSPAEALLCATRDGGAAADPTGMVGTLEEGKYADFVVVDGDPLADVRVLQDPARITAVVKDGKVWRGLMRDNPYLGSTDDLLAARAKSPARQRQVERILETEQ